jgi:hypothetical protein
MTKSNRTMLNRAFVFVPVAVVAETFLAVILCTVILDAFIPRPYPASVNTLLPGFTYASVAIMKVYLFFGLALIPVALLYRRANFEVTPVWSLIATSAVPISIPIVATIATIRLNATGWDQLTTSYFSTIGRFSVFLMLGIIVASIVAATISLGRKERPQLLTVMNLLTNILLVALFVHFRFYAYGFDQDTWAPN